MGRSRIYYRIPGTFFSTFRFTVRFAEEVAADSLKRRIRHSDGPFSMINASGTI